MLFLQVVSVVSKRTYRQDGELLIGSLPQKQMKILVGWLAFHEEEVYAAWELAVQGKHFNKIVAKI